MSTSNIEISWVKYSRAYSHRQILTAFSNAGLPSPQVIAPATMIARITLSDPALIAKSESVLRSFKVRYRKDLK